MNGVSLFTGAGGFEIGFNRAGIRTVLQAESDPWCREVLARHWPDVERIADVREVDAAALRGRCGDVVVSDHVSDAERFRDAGTPRRDHTARVDLVFRGWPCQDVSVAGKRAGLAGERSGLFYEFARIVRELRPRWIAAENVPGLLSSPTERPGVDFGIVLRTLVDLGYGMAWRILDGRWFGVPQRRRRPLLVGCLGDARRAAQVLAVCESCGGHPAPRTEARARPAYGLTARAASGSRLGPAWSTNYIAATLSGGGHARGVNLLGRHHEDDKNRFSGDADNLVARALRASDDHHGYSFPTDGEDNLIAFDYVNSGGSARNRPVRSGDYVGALGAEKVHDAISGTFGVRRLTPLECERLMGWPDEHTRWTSDGREIPDSHRYRMCGNGVIATVAEWLGHRLVATDRAVAAEGCG